MSGTTAQAETRATNVRTRSVDLRKTKGIAWHAVDATRNVLLPAVGLAWIIRDLYAGSFGWFEVVLLYGLLSLTSIGVTVGLHRYFTHRSFSAVPWLKNALAVLGSMTWQRPLLTWVCRHRLHHAASDQVGDYHSPHVMFDGRTLQTGWRKFLHGHYLWVHVAEPNPETVTRVTADLAADPFLVWCDRNYDLLSLISILVPTLLGFAWYGTVHGAIQGLMWGGLGRISLVSNVTWSINSACHLWGKATYRTRDESRNIPLLGWLVYGEGYHNNHHAFPYSPRFGFDPGQVDFGWYLISSFARLGWVHDLKPIPTLAERARRKLQPEGQSQSKEPGP